MICTILVFAGVSPDLPALAQNPVPLPTDQHLAASVGVSGRFYSATRNATRSLNMSAWVAAFAPGEPFDFSALESRAFLTLGLPEEEDWGLFEAVDPDLTERGVWSVTRALPKGYKFKALGNVMSPLGYQGGSSPEFFVPGSTSVSLPCTLTLLLELKIYTVHANNQPTSAHVQVKNASGTVVAEGDSTRQSDGRYAFSTTSLSPGSYTLTATGLWSGTATVNVQRGIMQEATLTVRASPPLP